MILRIKPLVIASGTGCNAQVEVASKSNTILKIRHRGVVLINTLIDDIYQMLPTPISGFFIDNNGVSIPYALTVEAEPSSGVDAYLPKLKIDFNNVYDYVDLDIEFNYGQNQITYRNVFRIYGYDLGVNADVLASQYNSKFDILISEDSTLPYFIAYRKPFTNQIDIYNASSFIQGGEYFVDGEHISSMSNFSYCNEQAVDITRYYGECYYTQSILFYRWIPLWDITRTCSNCNPGDCECGCESIYSTQGAKVNIDFTTMGVMLPTGWVNCIFCDDIRIYPFKALVIKYELFDTNLVSVGNQTSTFNLPLLATTTQWNADNYSFSFSSLDVGAYQLTVCLEILGIPEFIKSGSLKRASYYQVQHDISSIIDDVTGVTWDESDFSSVTSVSSITLQDVIYTDQATLLPTWDKYGNLTEVIIQSSDLVDNKYYMISNIDNNADFGNLTNNEPTIIGHCFYGFQTPTSWGTSMIIGDYNGGAVVEVTPVITCCKNILIEACQPYTVEQPSCNSIKICNYDTEYSLTYLIKEFNGTTFVNTVNTGTLTLFETTAKCITVSNLKDGIYIVEITRNSKPVITTDSIIIVDCEITTCKLEYLKKLICCNPETNCNCGNDDCSKKNYYDFNAFSIILQSYFEIAEYVKSYGYYYTVNEITSLMSDITTVYDLLKEASKYCMTCNEPCNEC